MQTSTQSDAGTILSEVSNQSETLLQLRPLSPKKRGHLALSGQNIWLPKGSSRGFAEQDISAFKLQRDVQHVVSENEIY